MAACHSFRPNSEPWLIQYIKVVRPKCLGIFQSVSTTVLLRQLLCTNVTLQWRIQDFPEEGAPTPRGGAPTYDFAKFSQKLHEIERIWAPRGGGARVQNFTM